MKILKIILLMSCRHNMQQNEKMQELYKTESGKSSQLQHGQ